MQCNITASIFPLTTDHLELDFSASWHLGAAHFFIVLVFELEMKMRRPTKSMRLIPTTMMMVSRETLRNLMGNSEMMTSTVAFA